MAGRYGGAVMITLSYLIWIYLISYSGSIFSAMLAKLPFFGNISESVTSDIIFTVISALIFSLLNIIAGMFQCGINLYYLNISTGRDAQPADLFAGFRSDPAKVFKVSAFIMFPTIITSVIFNIFAELYVLTHDQRFFILSWATLVPALAITLYMNLTYGMAYFLLLDFPKYPASRILSLTRKKITGHRMRLLLLDLRFIPMLLLCILSMGLGILWVYPILSESHALFFLNLMNPDHYVPIDERV